MKTEKLTIEEVRQHAAYLRLSQKQRLFVETWIASGRDRVLSVQTAYRCPNPKVALTFSYEILSSPKIRTVLGLLAGRDESAFDFERERDIRRYEKQLRAAKPGSTPAVQLTRLIAGLKYDTSKPGRKGKSAPEYSRFDAGARYEIGTVVFDLEHDQLGYAVIQAVDDRGVAIKVSRIQVGANGQPKFKAGVPVLVAEEARV